MSGMKKHYYLHKTVDGSMKTGFYLYTTVDEFEKWLKSSTFLISARRFPSGEGYFYLLPASRGRWTVDGSTILEMKGTYIAPRTPDEPNMLEACPVEGQISFQVIALPLSEGIKVTAECANMEVFGDFFREMLDLIGRDFAPEENPQVWARLNPGIDRLSRKLSPNYVAPQAETPPQAAPSPEQSQVSDKPSPTKEVEAEPWERIPDKGWDRTALKLWHKGYEAKDIGLQLNKKGKTITNRMCALRKRYGEEVVPKRK